MTEIESKVRKALAELACIRKTPFTATADARTRAGVKQLVDYASNIGLLLDHFVRMSLARSPTDSGIDQAAQFVLDWIDKYEGRRSENKETSA